MIYCLHSPYWLWWYEGPESGAYHSFYLFFLFVYCKVLYVAALSVNAFPAWSSYHPTSSGGCVRCSIVKSRKISFSVCRQFCLMTVKMMHLKNVRWPWSGQQDTWKICWNLNILSTFPLNKFMSFDISSVGRGRIGYAAKWYNVKSKRCLVISKMTWWGLGILYMTEFLWPFSVWAALRICNRQPYILGVLMPSSAISTPK